MLLGFMKGLRSYFSRKYPMGYAIGSVYSNETTITYFPFTPKTLKEKHLKIAIVFNHQHDQFEVWLAGQNKAIQKKYWEFFKNSERNMYHIPASIEEGFSIVDKVLIDHPAFDDVDKLIQQIESGTIAFINDVTTVLE